MGGRMNKISERRNPGDRRQLEAGPPHGWRDRRRRTERRIPEIEECVVSESEWQHYFGRRPAVAAADSLTMEQAADIFGRVRDS